MKYCPKCGNRLTTNDKYCDKCGTDVSNVTTSQLENVQRVQTNNVETKNSKLRRNCLIIVACVVMLTAAGVVFFTLQSENMNNSLPFISRKEKTDHAAARIGYTPNKKMSSKDTAGFTIAYAHMNFPDDSDWAQAYDKCQMGELDISSYPEYNFGDYDVKAPQGGAVYVVTPDLGYVVSDVNNPSDAQITYINSKKGAEKPVYFHTLAKKVAHSPHKNEVRSLGRKVEVVTKKTTPKKSDSELNSKTKSRDKLSWDDAKEKQLADFMDDFGDKMDQDYDEYNGDDALETNAGQKYPDIFEDTDFKLTDDNKVINIGWDPELKKDDDYHVVSIFNYDGDSDESHITYLFCIHDNQPVVLVDQTTNGDDVSVKETENADLKNGFAKIVNGDDSDNAD